MLEEGVNYKTLLEFNPSHLNEFTDEFLKFELNFVKQNCPDITSDPEKMDRVKERQSKVKYNLEQLTR